MLERLIAWFPLWAVLLAAVAFAVPAPFAALSWAIGPLLGIIMFGMGMTLSVEDFRRVAQRPAPIGLGMLLQYTVMPLAAFVVARLLDLPPDLAVGLVLVGSSAGGTASNVICYIARGDVALSITLTASPRSSPWWRPLPSPGFSSARASPCRFKACC